MPCHHPWASLFCLSLSFSFSPFLMSTFISLAGLIIPSSSCHSAAQIIIRHLHLQREPDSILFVE
ncbi:hypothetical protein V8C43DRAFT_290655 [Trichoderma afarasin]